MQLSRLAVAAFFLAMVGCSMAEPNRVRSINLRTGTCDSCGMNTDAGSVRFTLCGSGHCCDTPALDTPFVDDFKANTITPFFQGNIGECQGFDVTSFAGYTLDMVVVHEGEDDVKFEDAFVFTDLGIYHCYFNKFLIGKSAEKGHTCSFDKFQ